MGDANRVTKAIFAVAVAATVMLISVVIFFLTARVVEAEKRALTAEKTLSELTTQNRGPQGPEGDPGPSPTQEQIAAAVADYCNQEGEPCKGDTGAAGAPGKNGSDGQSIQGPQGASGRDGKNGAGITNVVCNGTSISFYSGNSLVGSVKMVCLR